MISGMTTGEVCPFMIITSEKETSILEYIYNDNSIKQRDIAEKAGISLGMTNAVLRTLEERGFLTIEKVNSRNIRYRVSPAGVEEIHRHGCRSFRETAERIAFYRREIENLVDQVAVSGFRKVVLAGSSNLDFLVEYACIKRNIEFCQVKGYKRAEKADTYIIISEQNDDYTVPGNCRLCDIVIRGKKK